MDYQPRTIAYLCDLLHPPQAPEPRPIQKLHNRMFEGGAPTYATFAVTPLGPVLANPAERPGAASQAAFLGDRFQFREELGDMTIETFGERVRTVAGEAAGLRGIGHFTGQQVTLRSLINPRHYSDSRAFLSEAVFGFGEEVEELGRAPQLYGLRLAFPPAKGEANALSLRLESYNADARSLFLEVQASFGPIPLPGGVSTAALEPIERNVQTTYAFLTDRVLPFVARFDARQPS